MGHVESAAIRAQGFRLVDAPFGSQPLERYARAELLLARAKLDEARRWYASLPETTMDKVIFLAAVSRRLAEIAQRSGDTRTAAEYLRRARQFRAGTP